MSYRNILLTVFAFLALNLLLTTAAAQQTTPAEKKREQKERDKTREKKTEKSNEDGETEVVEPRRNAQDDTLDPNVFTAPSVGDKRYRFEVGILPRFNNNLFEDEDDAAKRSAFITTLSAKAEYDFIRKDRRTFTGVAQIRYNIYKGLKEANSIDIDLGMRLQSGKNDLQTTYFTTPERLAFITRDNLVVHSRTQGLNLDYTRRLTRRFRARGNYQTANENYEGTTFDDRNNTRHRLTGDVRYRLYDLFQPGIGVEYERINARSENFQRHSLGPILLVVSSYKDIVYTSARYRYIQREYDTDNPLLSNFGRRDNRHDFSIYSTIKLNRQLRLFAFYNALDNSSSFASRSFSGYQTGAGLYFRFP
jgi:hypothetical protein